MPGLSRAADRPKVSHGLQSGDIDATSGMIWARSDRPARMQVDVATTESFKDALRLEAIDARPASDFAVKRLLINLPSDQTIFYRLRFANLSHPSVKGEPVIGRFRTAPRSRRDIRFVWSGDTAGQGWGINPDDGGMKTYAAMGRHDPDFFIHSGDVIYADGPIKPEARLPGGGRWKNIVKEGVGKVAETLDEFRGRFKYNLLDENLRAFNAQVPTFVQWDDHDVIDNWSPAKDLKSDNRYKEKSIAVLAERAAQAFHEMTPICYFPEEPGRIYRKIPYGPLLDVFFLDLRSYRGGNGPSLETEMTPASRIIGETQMLWLKRELALSRATWKVIACDMPIGLIVWDDWKEKKGVEAIANGDQGKAKGRELEIADLLRFINASNIANVVWLTADVHYTAAHYYNPDKAQFQDFAPFWEFVSGPLHAGTFGPNELDRTFGPEVRFIKAPTKEQGVNLPPSMGMQFFGLVDIEGKTGQMTVRLMDRDDKELYKVTLDPATRG
ncbi:alkaline phosphatase D family protein [Taklimakanibacter lacteus]|uniref:alkaline phosphatase D family protein n=1 Tax=Taklimakanibacter lacteus TaxID=2268456 RepID=UPI000E673ECC